MRSVLGGEGNTKPISDVKASGELGLIYRFLGSANIGKAVLSSHKAYLEKLRE